MNNQYYSSANVKTIVTLAKKLLLPRLDFIISVCITALQITLAMFNL